MYTDGHPTAATLSGDQQRRSPMKPERLIEAQHRRYLLEEEVTPPAEELALIKDKLVLHEVTLHPPIKMTKGSPQHSSSPLRDLRTATVLIEDELGRSDYETLPTER